MAEVDPITLAVVWGGLQAVAQEMGIVLKRTAYSEAVREGEDFSTAVFDASGRLIAQGDYSPGHLGAMPFAVKRIAQEFPAETLSPGDVILQNDPQIGSGHLPDFFLFYPVFYKNSLAGWTANTAHQADVGGAGLGSQVIESISDLFQEGIRFLPMKFYEKGQPVEAVTRIIAGNVRLPDKVLGDLKAQLNSCRVGATRFQALLDLYGTDTVFACTEEIMRRSEEAIRAAIREIPDGTYHFVDHLDDSGRNTEPIRVEVTLTIAGDEVIVDLAGSSSQRECGMNSYYNYTYSYVLACVRAMTEPSIPQNEGCTRPLRLVVPEGCFFNPRPPAACAARHITCNRIFEATLGAFAQAIPDKAFSGTGHVATPIVGGTNPQNGKKYFMYDMVMRSVGARATADGIEAVAAPWNATNIPIEVHEIGSPVLVERFEFVTDSAGPGKHRGGLAVRKDVRILGEDIKLFNAAERQKFSCYGLQGGKPGQPGVSILNPGPDQEVLHSKGIYRLKYGDVLRTQVASSGGYGDPLERDPERVLADVIKECVSIEGARRDYSVVVDPDTLTIDVGATEKLRAERKGKR